MMLIFSAKIILLYIFAKFKVKKARHMNAGIFGGLVFGFGVYLNWLRTGL